MIKYSILSLAIILLAGCSTQNESYYRLHPMELKKAIQNCPSQHPAQLSCEQLSSLAESMNQLAYDLQSSPQGFGRHILALQQQLADQTLELQKKPDQPELSKTLAQTRKQISEYMGIVKWLESPER